MIGETKEGITILSIKLLLTLILPSLLDLSAVSNWTKSKIILSSFSQALRLCIKNRWMKTYILSFSLPLEKLIIYCRHLTDASAQQSNI